MRENPDEESLRVVIVAPEKQPYEQHIGSDLANLQAVVDGSIQAVYPFDDNAALICNEEGKLLGLPPNRLLKDRRGDPYDVLCGTFFIAGLGEEDFCSLTDQQVARYKELYSREMLFSVPNQTQEKTQSSNKKKHKSIER